MIGRRSEQTGFIESMMVGNRIKETFLDRVDQIIDWKPIRKRIERAYSKSGTGRPTEDVIILMKGLMLAQWYGLSDPELEAAINDRISFSRFVGLSLSDNAPDETTFCRFRNRLKEKNLSEWIFRELNRQLAERGILIKRGSLVDATMVEASVNPPTKKDVESGKEATDLDAKWGVKGNNFVYGYKAHASTDPESELIQDLEMTDASVHDSEVFEELVPEEASYVIADKGYANQGRKRQMRKDGRYYGIMDKGYRNTPLTKKQRKRNKVLSKIRCHIERLFAHLKARYKYWQVRYVGLAANRSHLFLLGVAYNLKRSVAVR